MLGFEKDDKDLPPTYDSTLQQTLKASSHGVELIIPTPPSGTFLPGDVVRGRVGIPNDILNSMEGGLRCRLEGKSSVEVMGKSRYQKAQLISASMGSAPVPISARDEHTFALDIKLIPKPDSSGGTAEVPLEIRVREKKNCNCTPSDSGRSGDGILPSLGWKGSFGERNRVRWQFEVVIVRKGLMKRDIKLSIEIPVSLPRPTSSKTPLIAAGSKALIYKSSNTSSAPELETSLTVYPCSPASPRRIPFRINLVSPLLAPSSSTSSTLAGAQPKDSKGLSGSLGPSSGSGSGMDDPKISLGLCKHTWTKGLHTSVGSDKGHDFPGIMVGSLKLDDTRPDIGRGYMELAHGNASANGSGGVVIEGEFQVEEDEITALGCGLRLSWSLQVQIRWKKLDSPMVISQLIQLPHYSAT